MNFLGVPLMVWLARNGAKANEKGIVGILSTLRPPATVGAHEADPLSALLIYGYELNRNKFSA
jgi:hypothetical protein